MSVEGGKKKGALFIGKSPILINEEETRGKKERKEQIPSDKTSAKGTKGKSLYGANACSTQIEKHTHSCL